MVREEVYQVEEEDSACFVVSGAFQREFPIPRSFGNGPP